MSNITDEDVSILMSQANIDKKTAREVLIINNGDLVDSICKIESGEINVNDLEKFKENINKDEDDKDEEIMDFEVDTSNPKNLVKYREIVDAKDTIYNIKKEEKYKKEELAKKIEERRSKGEKVEDVETPEFSIEDLYNLKRGDNTFNSITVL